MTGLFANTWSFTLIVRKCFSTISRVFIIITRVFSIINKVVVPISSLVGTWTLSIGYKVIQGTNHFIKGEGTAVGTWWN